MRDGTSMTAWYSVLHMLVDGVCAMAMFGDFLLQKEGYLYMLLYNFCAFALQMPFGVVLDILNESGARMCISGKDTMDSKMIYEKKEWSFIFAVVGVLCTILGVVTNPIILGVGNALFHVGGGVGTIHEDERKKQQAMESLEKETRGFNWWKKRP